MLLGRAAWGPVAANVHEQSAVSPLNNRRFPKAEAGHRMRGVPRVAVIVGVDCVHVMLRPLALAPAGSIIHASVEARRPDEPSGSESDAAFVHVQIWQISAGVWQEGGIEVLP